MRTKALFLTILLLPTLSMAGGNSTNDSFSRSKKTLLNRVYYDHRTTFYCDCLFGPDKTVPPSDKYKPKRENSRSSKVEWEHVVPAHAFGQSFPEWRNGAAGCVDKKGKGFKGRKCARLTSKEFRLMEADMYNLVPAIGEINGDRSNYSYGIIPGEPRDYGPCDFEIESRKVEPREEIRGDIARIYMYMDWAYPGHGIISKKNRKMFDVWDNQDPVDARECERARRIEEIQGNENPFVKKQCEH